MNLMSAGASRRRESVSSVLALGLLLCGLLVMAAGCSLSGASLAERIVGTWVNEQGGRIDFYADGTGFVPGVDENTPEAEFTYALPDEEHLSIGVPGMDDMVIEIDIDGDTMTWRGTQSGKEFVYTRAKQTTIE